MKIKNCHPKIKDGTDLRLLPPQNSCSPVHSVTTCHPRWRCCTYLPFQKPHSLLCLVLMWFVQQPHKDVLLVPPVTSGWHAMIFSCPGQLKRWTCHSSTHWRFDFSVFRALHSCHWHMRHIRRRRRRRRCKQFSDFSDSVDYSWQIVKLESWHWGLVTDSICNSCDLSD